MYGSNVIDLFLTLTFLVTVFAIFGWFASQPLKGSKRERGAFAHAHEKNRELLETGKITRQEFGNLKRGLEP